MRTLTLIFQLLLLVSLSACQTGKQLPNPPSPKKATIKAQQQWRVSAGNGSGGYYLKLSPALDHGNAYTSSFSGEIKAIDKRQGKTIWRQHLNEKLTSGVGESRHFIYVGSENGTLYALRKRDGHVVWQKTLPNEILARPHYAHGRLFVKCEDGSIQGLKAINGALLWSHKEDMPTLALRGSSDVQTRNDRVIAGFANGKVVAFGAKTGQLLWRQTVGESRGDSPVSQMVDVDAQPVIRGDKVYVVGYQGHLMCLSIKTGNIIWRHDFSSFSGLTVDSSQVYVTDAKGKVWAFDRRTGAKSWLQTGLKGRALTRPVLTSQGLVFGDEQGYIYWLKPSSGQLTGRYQAKGSIVATPLALAHGILVYTQAGYLYRLKVNS